MNPSPPAARIDRFLAHLADAVRRDDRCLLADLRHGFSDTTAHRAWPHLAPYCDLRNPTERAVWTVVGGGYATLAPAGLAKPGVGNVGATMRRLALAGHTGKPDDALQSFDARFRRLLTCQDAAELCVRLVTVIRAAKAKETPMDFRKLYEDLSNWGARGPRDVRVEWATAYWGVPAPTAADREGDAA